MTTSPLSRQEYKVQVDQMGNGQSYQHVERQQDMYSDLMMRDRQMMDRQRMMEREQQRMDMDRQRMMYDMDRQRKMDRDQYMMDKETHRMMIKREALSDPAFTYTVMAEHPSTSNQMMSSSVYQLPLARQNMNLRQMTMKQIHPDG